MENKILDKVNQDINESIINIYTNLILIKGKIKERNRIIKNKNRDSDILHKILINNINTCRSLLDLYIDKINETTDQRLNETPLRQNNISDIHNTEMFNYFEEDPYSQKNNKIIQPHSLEEIINNHNLSENRLREKLKNDSSFPKTDYDTINKYMYENITHSEPVTHSEPIKYSPLLSLSTSEREKLEYDIFLTAKKNIQRLLPDTTDVSILEPLYFKEADRLLNEYTNSFNKTTC